MAILTKSDILRGIQNIQKVRIESLNGEIYLRPLSSAELDEINYMEAEGMGIIEQSNKGASLQNASQSSKMNVLKLTKATDNAKYELIRLSINNEKNSEVWELEDIKQLPRDAVKELQEKIKEISKWDVTDADVKQFLED